MLRTRLSARALGTTALLGVGLLLAGCAGGGPVPAGATDSLEDMDPVVLRVALPLPETATPSLGMKAFADYAREESNGKLDFEFYFNGTLIPGAELLPGLSSGLADIGLVVNSWAPDKLANGAWADQFAPAVEEWGFPQVAVSSAVQTSFAFGNDVIREELARENVVPLFASATGPFFMLCVDPFETPEDLAGRTVRVGGEPWATEVTKLGMTPIFLPGSETYEGLQRGVIDCTYQDPSSIVTTGLMEVAHHIALTDGSLASGSQLAINKDVWDSLPVAAQQILFDANVPAMIAWSQGTMDLYQDVVEDAQEIGVTFAPIDELDRMIQQNREAHGEDVRSSPPASVKNPDALREDFEDAANQWDALWEEHIGLERASKSSLESTVEAFGMGSEAVDWEAFEAAVTEQLRPVRP